MLAFTKIGLMPDGGASALIAAAVGRIRAMHMALLPDRLPAAEALSWGLVSAVYPADAFEAEVDKVITRLLAGPVAAFGKTKLAINAATLPSWIRRCGVNTTARPSCCGPTTSSRAQRLSSSAARPSSPIADLWRLPVAHTGNPPRVGSE